MGKQIYNIVIADDDLDDQFFMREALKNIPIEQNVVSVYDGAALLDLLTHQGMYKEFIHSQPDLILLDLNMPVMDGLTALSKIKKDNNLKNIPIYIFSTSKHESDKHACKLLGADDFYTKPAGLAKLQSAVNDILSKAFRVPYESF